MHLHKDKNLFEEAIKATSTKFGIPEIYIEKDYWVTKALKAIFTSKVGNEAVFKGGTSLSKCFKMIERFSEDIDIVVLRQSGENDNQMKKKIKSITSIVSEIIPEIELEGVTHKRGQIRKTAHFYAKAFEGIFGQVRENIIIEASWLGNSEPYHEANVNCMIAEWLIENGFLQIVEEYGLAKFKLNVLNPARTFCEKIMSLVRFSYSANPYRDLGHKIRHLYDLYMLLKVPNIRMFFESKAFDEMICQVGFDDQASFRNNNDWLGFHPVESIIFYNCDQVWAEISKQYRQSFSNLVYGELPNENFILMTLYELRDRLRDVNWIKLLAS